MDSDNYTIKELKEGCQELTNNMCKLIKEFEDKFDLRMGLNVERDIETNDVVDITMALVNDRVYV